MQERTSTLNLLIYGESGTGKTTLAGSADEVPAMRPVLFIDIEGGTESLRHSYPNVEVVRVDSWKKMQDVYNALHGGGTGFSTVVLDSLTEIMKFNMDHVLDERKAKKDVSTDEPAEQRDWLKNIEQTRKFIRGFRDLKMHTIFTALAREDKDPKSGKNKYKPSLSGKVADEAAAFLDIVLYYYIREVKEEVDGEPQTLQKRLLLSRKTESHIAKDRTGKLPRIIQEPTMAEIFEYIKSKQSGPQETEMEQLSA